MIAATLPPEPPAIPWLYPDRDPYRGSPAEAARLFVAAGLPAAIVRRQFREFAAGQCRVRDLDESEPILLMLFDRDRVLRDIIAEPDRWAAGISRRVVECDVDGGGQRYALLRPFACGNWSEEITPLSPVWGVPFAPPTGPLPGYAELLGRNEEVVGGFGGSVGAFGAFAGGWAAGISPGFVPEQNQSVNVPREISFVTVPPGSQEYRARHWFRRRWHRAEVRFPAPTLPPITPPIPPAHVPEPASGWLLAGALALLGFLKWRLKCR